MFSVKICALQVYYFDFNCTVGQGSQQESPCGVDWLYYQKYALVCKLPLLSRFSLLMSCLRLKCAPKAILT